MRTPLSRLETMPAAPPTSLLVYTTARAPAMPAEPKARPSNTRGVRHFVPVCLGVGRVSPPAWTAAGQNALAPQDSTQPKKPTLMTAGDLHAPLDYTNQCTNSMGWWPFRRGRTAATRTRRFVMENKLPSRSVITAPPSEAT